MPVTICQPLTPDVHRVTLDPSTVRTITVRSPRNQVETRSRPSQVKIQPRPDMGPAVDVPGIQGPPGGIPTGGDDGDVLTREGSGTAWRDAQVDWSSINW